MVPVNYILLILQTICVGGGLFVLVKIDGNFVPTITIELYTATTFSSYFMEGLLSRDKKQYWKAVMGISIGVILVTTILLVLSCTKIFPNYNMGIYFMLVFNIAYVMFLK